MKKKFLIPLFILCSLFIAVTATIGYAYFSNYNVYKGFMGAEVELLFDRLSKEPSKDSNVTSVTGENVSPLEYYQTQVLQGTYQPDEENAPWGSKENPYVISNVKHLYNLAELQRLGYFEFFDENNNISQNYTVVNGEKIYSKPASGWVMPYFLVCTPDGTPVTIDGSTFDREIAAIGTEAYPFIGSVKGAFLSGEHSINETTKTNFTCTVSEKSSDTSAICNITVRGNTDNVDIGLFGYVGFLGNEPKLVQKENTDGTPMVDENGNPVYEELAPFDGQISELSNLLLCDIEVKVQDSLWDKATAFVENHFFAYKELPTSEQSKVPHETHHIGILAGHVSYTKVEFISVYYSDDSKVAIDLSHKSKNDGKANYMSSSGIIGFLDNMNPTVANGFINTGTGQNSSDLSYSTVGGGGLLSGTQAGYVLASKMYETYHWNGSPASEDTTGTIKIKDALTADGTPLCTEWVRDRILWGTENTGKFYFYDGVFTFALSSQQDTIEPTWDSDDDKTFAVGANDPSMWDTNIEKGNNIVVAFVNPITSLDELNAVIASGDKQIFVAHQNSATSDKVALNMMSLYESNTNTSLGQGYPFESITKDTLTTAQRESVLEGVNPNNQYSLEGWTSDEKSFVYNGLTSTTDPLYAVDLGIGQLGTIETKFQISISGSQGAYQFSCGDNYLNFVTRRVITNFFNFCCGTDTQVGSTRGHIDNSKNATIIFNDNKSNPYCTISFTANYQTNIWGDTESTTRYLSYSNEELEAETSNTSVSTHMYLYTVELLKEMNFGRITFDPAEGTEITDEGGDATSTDTHVLFANSNKHETLGDTYSVISLEALNWNNGSGSVLSSADLQKKFHMLEGITFGASLNIINGSLSSGGFLQAPVGSNGVKANIPSSCVAFRINKADGDKKIRVIVAVPQSDFYIGETIDGVENTFQNYTRYLNLWKMEEAGESWIQVFDAGDYQDRFLIPTSTPYEPGTSAQDNVSSSVKVNKFVSLDENGNTVEKNGDYRCYMNGDKMLVAYEFTVTEAMGEGVYILGMSGVSAVNGTNETYVEDAPMEIVYFSADGVASAGRDGNGGSQMGTIDFVYDYSNKILTVKESYSTTDKSEDYSTYYPSFIIAYFDNNIQTNTDNSNPEFVYINYEQVRIRRWVNDSSETTIKSTVNLWVGPTDHPASAESHVKISPYARLSDIINATYSYVTPKE